MCGRGGLRSLLPHRMCGQGGAGRAPGAAAPPGRLVKPGRSGRVRPGGGGLTKNAREGMLKTPRGTAARIYFRSGTGESQMLEKQQPYKYRVYEEIKNAILSEQYAPGTVLNERKLSEELGISRTPVREALQMLEKDGWLQAETYKGTVVRAFDASYMHEILEIRTALELLAVQNAARNMTDAELQSLAEIHREQQEALNPYDGSRFILIDRKFHNKIYECSGNRELVRLLGNYYDIFLFLGMRAIAGSAERRLTTIEEHKGILDALRSKDERAAAGAMKKHMEQTEANVIANIRKIQPGAEEEKK